MPQLHQTTLMSFDAIAWLAFINNTYFVKRKSRRAEAQSRISDPEMETLMIDVVDQCYAVLTSLFRAPDGDELVKGLTIRDPMPRWNDPPSDDYAKRQQRERAWVEELSRWAKDNRKK